MHHEDVDNEQDVDGGGRDGDNEHDGDIKGTVRELDNTSRSSQ